MNSDHGSAGYPDDDVTDEELKKIAEPHKYDPETGKKAGVHNGAHFFTIGQRKGMNVGGHKEPLFVIAIDVEKNIVYVGEGQSHPGLYRKGLFIRSEEVHWIRPDLGMKEGEEPGIHGKNKVRQPLQKARLYKRTEGIYIIFNKLQRGIAPGQFAAWYTDDEVIGSGVINL